MRDRPKAEAFSQSITNARPSPPLVRAMANCICDHDIDALKGDKTVQIVLTLHRAGFSIKEIEINMDDAIMMACVRQRKERRRR